MIEWRRQGARPVCDFFTGHLGKLGCLCQRFLCDVTTQQGQQHCFLLRAINIFSPFITCNNHSVLKYFCSISSLSSDPVTPNQYWFVLLHWIEKENFLLLFFRIFRILHHLLFYINNYNGKVSIFSLASISHEPEIPKQYWIVLLHD